MYITEWVFAIITSLGLTNTFPVFNLCDVWCWTTEMGTWVCMFCFFFFRLHRLDKLELQKKKVWLIISGELSCWFHDCRMEFRRGRYLQDELSNWLRQQWFLSVNEENYGNIRSMKNIIFHPVWPDYDEIWSSLLMLTFDESCLEDRTSISFGSVIKL